MQSRREFLETSGISVAGAALLTRSARALAAGPLPASELPMDPTAPYEIVGSPYLRTSDAVPLSQCRTLEEEWEQMVHFRMPDDWRTRYFHGF